MLLYAPWLVWMIPLASAALMPLVAALSDRARNIFAVLVGFTTAAYALSMIRDGFAKVINPQAAWVSVPGIFTVRVGVYMDPISIFMANVAAGIGALILLYSLGYMSGEEGLTRYYCFMLMFIGAMIGLVMADNFLQLYIFWEVVGLCSYALIGFWYKRPEARKAGMKAFMVTRIGDIFLLAGIIFIYINGGGDLSFSGIISYFTAGRQLPEIFSIIPLLLLMGAIGKSAQLPLHTWLPDAMEGPTTVSALIHAATMVAAGVYLMARTSLIFSLAGPQVVSNWLTALAWIGGVTAFSMALLGLVAVDIKRVLAYSTISQIGYMMLAIGLTAGAAGVFVSQFHLMSHAIFKALLFLCAGAILHATGTRDMRQMGGLARKMPVTFVTCVIGVLGLSAIPPFNGFWSKELVFELGFEAENWPLLILAVLTAVITFAYSLRMIANTFFGKPSDYLSNRHVHETPVVMTVPLVILAALTMITGFLGPGFSQFLGLGVEVSLVPNLNSLSLSIIALLAGGIPAYFVYVRRSIRAESFRSGMLAPMHKILENGYYFDRFYYKVFVEGYVKLSQTFRQTHTGILNVKVMGILVGIILFLMLVSIGG